METKLFYVLLGVALLLVGVIVYRVRIRRVRRELAMTLAAQQRVDEEKMRGEKRAVLEQAAELMRSNQALSRINERLATQNDYEIALNLIVEEISNVAGADAAMVARLEPEKGHVRLMCLSLNNKLVRPIPDELTDRVKIDHHAYLMNFTSAALQFVSPETASSEELPCKAWHLEQGHRLVIQRGLFSSAQPLGWLTVSFKINQRPSPAKTEMLNGLAEQATLALQLIRMAEEDKRNTVAREQDRAITAERARMAREIHDTLAQNFSGILLQLKAMQVADARMDDHARETHVASALELAQQGLLEARRSVGELRPSELEGRSLREALRLVTVSAERRSGIPVTLAVEDNAVVPPAAEAELLRIAQECVTNSAKHSGATAITVKLFMEEGAAVLCVEDNGRGFDPKRATDGFGLAGIRQRADRISAQFELETREGGTVVHIRLKQHASESLG